MFERATVARLVPATRENLHHCRHFRLVSAEHGAVYALYFDDGSDTPLFEVVDMEVPHIRLALAELEGWLPSAPTIMAAQMVKKQETSAAIPYILNSSPI